MPAPTEARWPPKTRRHGMSLHTLTLWPDDRKALEILREAFTPEIPLERLPLSPLVRLALRHEAARRSRDARTEPGGAA